MNTRDFMKMPLGKFKATDGIYNYDIEKKHVGEFSETLGKFTWMIRDAQMNLTGNWLHLYIKYVHYNDLEYKYLNWKKNRCDLMLPILSGSTSCGGIRISQSDISWNLDKFELLPRGSFKKYVTDEITNDFYEMMNA